MKTSIIAKKCDQLRPEERKALLKALKARSPSEITLASIHNLIIDSQASYEAKEAALSILFDCANQTSEKVLLVAFWNDDHLHSSVFVLAKLNSKYICNQMIKAIKTAENPERRAFAAYLLGFYRYKKAQKALVEALDNISLPARIRSEAAQALAVIGDNSFTKVWANHLDDDTPIEVVYGCIWALSAVSMEASAIPKLKKFIGNKTIIDKMFVIDEEAKEAIRFIKARVKILKKHGLTDKSMKTYWKIHRETLEEVERVKKKTGELYKDMSWFRRNKLNPSLKTGF